MKTVIILIAIALGLSFPAFNALSWLIRSLVMLLLFFGFLVITFDREMLSKELLFIVIANLLLPLPVYYLTSSFGKDVSQAAFLVAATPTGVAVPVVIEFLGKKTHFAAMGVLLTNIVMAVALPLALPHIAEYKGEIGVYHTVSTISITVFVPLIASIVVRKFGGKLYDFAIRMKFLSLYLWAFAILLACSEARHFVIEYAIPTDVILDTGKIVVLVCALNFIVGYLIGGKKYRRESGQVLGQKNTIFSVWIGVTFLNPVSAIGPVCYIICQNLYNCAQIAIHDLRKKDK